MANLHAEFGTFHDKIKLANGKRDSLKEARDAIRERIRKHFREKLELTAPKFHGQGSYMMRTTVNQLNGEFDIDDGVYLQHLDESDDSDWPTPATVHRWLVEATAGHTKEKPIDKQTCVRVQYAGQYHVDLPAYAKLNGAYLLAVKGDKGWCPSDPKALTVWFIDRVKARGEQLRKIVRYLKAWADFQTGRRGKMVNGLILTVLASNNFYASERDDISLAETVKAISEAVKPVFEVRNPVDVTEKLTDRLTDVQEKRFQDAISDLAKDGADAVAAEDREEAAKLWRRQLGDRFPAVEEEEEKQNKADAARVAAVCTASNPPKPWGY